MGNGSSSFAGRSGGPVSPPPDRLGCDEFEQDIPLFVDGELGETERTRLEDHFGQCETCRGGARFARAFRERLRAADAALQDGPAPAHLRDRILCSLAEEAGAQRTLLAGLRRLWKPVPVAAGATAMGLTAWFWLVPPSDDVVREIAARHTRRLPLEIQSDDPRSLEQWLSDKVDFKVRVPRPKGPLGLVGARLSHVRDHSAVYLLYGNPQEGRQVALIVYDDPSRTLPRGGTPRWIHDREVYLANARGYNVALWKQNEVVYSLVSDDQEEIVEIIRAFDRP